MTETKPPLEYPPIPTVRRLGNERFLAGPDATVGDFWQWAYSGLIDNVTRGVLAEYLVAKAVGAAHGTRAPWAVYDVEHPDGFGIEVKSSAYLQAWAHKRLSTITFLCRPTLGWDPETGDFDPAPSRHAKIYVFALQTAQVQEDLNPLDISQWEFYVVPTGWLNERKRSQHSIGLTSLRASEFGTPVAWAGLRDAIAAAT